MRVVVQFSGGKDSHASLLWAIKKYGANKVTAVFCDTGWEHPITIEHIHMICEKHGVELITLRSKKYDGFVDMSVKKGRFPSSQRRFCTSELKVIPMIDWILDELKDNAITIQGIRASESAARAGMETECMFFKSYFEANKNGKKQSYRGADVREFCKHYDVSVRRPVFHWSAQEVIDCILDAGDEPNPLYKRGFSRVGCMPCVMCRMREIALLMNDKAMAQRLIDAEQKMFTSSARGNCFFSCDTVPEYARKHIDMKTGTKICTVQDVFDYVSGKNATLDMFDDNKSEGESCMSMYHGLCE